MDTTHPPIDPDADTVLPAESSSPAAQPRTSPAPVYAKRWDVAHIDFSRVEVDRVHDDDDLFYLVVSASFIETGSDTYTRNLIEHYADQPEIADWLQHQWEPEELQHGRALKTYAQAVWPEFDWDTAYAAFFDEYSKLCTVEELEDDRVLELVARCVVETGTSTYYQAIRDLTTEPVLADLANRIRTDEVQHYKHFYQYFRRLQAEQGTGRARILGALRRRLLELRDSDSEIALRHVWAHRHYPYGPDTRPFEEVSQRLFALVSARLPIDQAVKMILKPVALPHRIERWVERPLAKLARRAITA